MNSELDTFFLIMDKMFDILDYIECKYKNDKKFVEIELEDKTKYILNDNYIEKDYTFITNYSKIYRKDCMLILNN